MSKTIFKILAFLALMNCLLFSYLNFFGKTDMQQYKLIFLISSVAYFIFATLSVSRKTLPK
jgi:exosortase/archaeosortase